MIVRERRSPLHGTAFVADTPHSVADGVRRRPVVEGIPYLRAGRDALAAAALAALDAGNDVEALALLLADRDDWDRTTPPPHATLRSLAQTVETLTFREALGALAFGGVATYFAHRWSDPTFVAGLGLLAAHRPRGGRRSFELACGTGHYLRELARAGIAADGADVVFSKLWLARRFVAPDAGLVCFDAGAPWPLASGTYDLVHVHDAFYFLPRKAFVASEMRRVLGTAGTLAISHAHNAAVDNFSAGEALDAAGYAALFPGAAAYDDRALAAAVVDGTVPRAATAPELERAPALSYALGGGAQTPRACDGDVALPAMGARLVRNPLYGAAGGTRIAWPSERYAHEYSPFATYPAVTGAPLSATMSREPHVVRFARTRELVALPERW